MKSTEWMDSAACAKVGGDWWHPGKGVCQNCPVLTECRVWAIADPELTGIWGGLNEDERKRLRNGHTITTWANKVVPAHHAGLGIRALYDLGYTDAAIAHTMKRSREYVYKWRYKHGLRLNKARKEAS